MSLEDQATLEALEARIKAILPEQYQECYEDVQPVSMGSAGLKYDSDGKVAWNEIWGSFCDLAMAGGPPHKGTLLEPGSPAENPDRYREVVAEICRGVKMVTGLDANPSPVPGWVRVVCESPAAAGWLVRAIVMENVSARWEGTTVDLPAGPAYRNEKEIKNVITSIAKTYHYWNEHMWTAQQREIARLFETMAVESPLVQPALPGHDVQPQMAETIREATGLQPSGLKYGGWLGLECPDVHSAIWMMRALVASNILSRRQDTVLFVPVNPASDPGGETVAQSVIRIHGFAKARNIL
jgi:sirohydrochlorin cobaltochelatase